MATRTVRRVILVMAIPDRWVGASGARVRGEVQKQTWTIHESRQFWPNAGMEALFLKGGTRRYDRCPASRGACICGDGNSSRHLVPPHCYRLSSYQRPPSRPPTVLVRSGASG